MNKIKLTSLSLLLIFQMFASKAFSQEQTQNSFSLQQAIEYAKQNSANVKNAKIDLEIAKKKIWETTAMGLPQVNAKVSASYMLTVPSLISEFNSFSNIGTEFEKMYGMIGSIAAQTGNYEILKELQNMQNENALSTAMYNLGIDTATATMNDMRWGLTADITVSQLIFSGAYLVGLQTSKTYKELSEVQITNQNKMWLKELQMLIIWF